MIEILVPVYVVMALGAARVSYDVLAELRKGDEHER